MRSASRSASSRYCVVRSSVVPPSISPSMKSQSLRRDRGSRPVVGSSRKRTAGLPTRLAPRSKAAPHATGVCPNTPVCRVGQLELIEDLLGTLARLGAAEAVEAANHLEVLATREDLVDRRNCPASPIDPLSCLASLTTSNPATEARPASGLRSVVRMRMAVVLPAPLGPRSPYTVPSSTEKSTAARAWTSPNDFVMPSTSIVATHTPGSAGATRHATRLRSCLCRLPTVQKRGGRPLLCPEYQTAVWRCPGYLRGNQSS